MRIVLVVAGALALLGCERQEDYKILGNIEEPQNEIAVAIADVLDKNLGVPVRAVAGRGSLANLDSLEAGKADFAIVDNYSHFSNEISSLLPLYPQVLHILHRRGHKPATLRALLLSGKIYAGIVGSGTYDFVAQLITDLGLSREQIQFVDVLHLFEADVIFSFTDLLTLEELRDLTDYEMFSIDAVENLGKGSLAEGICIRHPQFEPFVIAKEVYGSFTTRPILTIKVDAVLVCRRDADDDVVYKALCALMDNHDELQKINPLLFNVNGEFEPSKLTYALHPGALKYLRRDDPTFIERYAEVLSVILSVLITIASSIYTLSRWQQARKKNKIDVFYEKLMTIRHQVAVAGTREHLFKLEEELRQTQEETIQLVVKEKLMADESFSIFLNLSRIVMEEIKARRSLKAATLPAVI